MSSGSNKVWCVRGVSRPEDHGEGDEIQGEAKTADVMPRLQGGAHNGVYDGTSESDAQDGFSDQVEPAADQSDITPAPHFRSHIS